jgi:hypothetical protein
MPLCLFELISHDTWRSLLKAPLEGILWSSLKPVSAGDRIQSPVVHLGKKLNVPEQTAALLIS